MTGTHEVKGLAFFCKVPSDLIGKVSHPAITTWCVLDDMADRHTGRCWPSHAYLADKVGVKERAICNYLKELEGTGRLKRIVRPGTSTLYVLDFSAKTPLHTRAVPHTDAVSTAHTCSTPLHTDAVKLEPVNKNQEPLKKVSPEKGTKFTPVIPDDLQQFHRVIVEWIEYKKERKSPYKSERGWKQVLTKMRNLGAGLPASLQNSMANNWAGFFEVKNTGQFSEPEPSAQYKRSLNDYTGD